MEVNSYPSLNTIKNLIFDSNTNDKINNVEIEKNNQLIEKYLKNLSTQDDLMRQFDFIYKDMIKLGYPPKLIYRCFIVNKFSILEDGIELLSKNGNKWNHNYIEGYKKCFICDDSEENHSTNNMNNIIHNEINNKIKNVFFKRLTSDISININENSIKISLSECPICFIEIDPNNQYNYNCQHKFCKDCITIYLEEEIKNARINDLKCPVKGCNTIFDEIKIKGLVNEEYFKKYKKFVQREKIKNDKTLLICPISNCEGFTKIQDDSNNFLDLESNTNEPLLKNDSYLNVNKRIRYVCNFGHSFCNQCNQAWHGSSNCNEDNEIKDFATHSGYILKKCPKCMVWIEKNEGCNHMKCKVCEYNFCWLCENECPDNHFFIYGTPCYGKQFDNSNDLNRILNDDIGLSLFVIIFLVLFYLNEIILNRLVSSTRGFCEKLIAYLFMIVFYGYIGLIMIISNLIILIQIIFCFKTINNINYSRVDYIAIWTYLVLYFLYFITGIWIVIFWYIGTIIHMSIKFIIS